MCRLRRLLLPLLQNRMSVDEGIRQLARMRVDGAILIEWVPVYRRSLPIASPGICPAPYRVYYNQTWVRLNCTDIDETWIG